MNRPLIFILFALSLISCNSRKKGLLVQYNDDVVNIMEQADITMRNWNAGNMMVDYEQKKDSTKTVIGNLQDSLRHINPPSKDDTLRLSGISILTGYMQALSVYDTIYFMLNDSLYLREDSIRVETLLKTTKNLIEQESASFAEIQKRFAERYELNFMQ